MNHINTMGQKLWQTTSKSLQNGIKIGASTCFCNAMIGIVISSMDFISRSRGNEPTFPISRGECKTIIKFKKLEGTLLCESYLAHTIQIIWFMTLILGSAKLITSSYYFITQKINQRQNRELI